MAAINLHRKCKTKTTVMYKEVSKRLRRRLREVAGSGCQADHVRDVLCSMQVRAVSICDKSSSLPRYERRRAQICLQVSCISEVDVRVASLVGVCHSRRKKRIWSFCSARSEAIANDPTPTELATDSDSNLFGSVLYNCHHVLKQLLPDKTDHQYNLRHRRHNLSLSVKHDSR